MTAEHTDDRLSDRLVLTVEEVAGLLGVSRWLVQQAAHNGELPCIRLGRRILFPRTRIQAIVNGEPLTEADSDAPTFDPPSEGAQRAAAYPQPPAGRVHVRAFRAR